MGGIRNGADAFEFILAGADAVSVGTVVFNDPSAPARVHAELAAIAAGRGFTRLRDAVSYAHREPEAEDDDADDDGLAIPEWV
jgi:dihydroorotate dehydrogenase (NAD+) catalytic subunit